MESWGAAGGVNTSSFCRAWLESAIRWKYPDLVWTYLEPGAISTDGGETLETRTDFGETVVVQTIITAGTIDEDVMKALANKDMTQNRSIAAVKARVTHGEWKNQFEDPYERLANAIILIGGCQITEPHCLKKVKRNPKSKSVIDEALQYQGLKSAASNSPLRLMESF